MNINSVAGKEASNMFFRRLLLITIMLGSPTMIIPALAHDLTVNVTGSVTNTTCSVSPESAKQSVYLGEYSAREFTSAGKGPTPTLFTINLEKCGAVSHGVEVTFTGTPDDSILDNFKLSPESTGSGISLTLMDDAKKKIPVNGTSKVYAITDGTTTKSLIFYAQMVANGQKVKPGVMDFNVTFSTLYP